MAELRLGDAPVLRARVTLPRFGVWHADLLIDTDATPSGALTLATDDAGLSLRGTVVSARSGSYQDRCEVRLVGGAGGLGTVLEPRYYESATLRVLLSDLARETGETLSSSIDPALLGTVYPKWTRGAGEAGTALALLLGNSGLAWRVLGDGTLWVGAESWPNVEVPGDILTESAGQGTRTVATDTLYGLLAPGTVWDGRYVSCVEHTIDADQARTLVWFEAAPSAPLPGLAPGSDRVKGPLERVVANLTRRFLFRALFPGAVLAQHGDGTVDVALDSAALPHLVNVPVRGPDPAHTARFGAGARVLVAFEGGEPSAPSVVAFEPGSCDSVTFDAAEFKIGAGATRGIVRLNDAIARNVELATWMGSVETALSALSAPIIPFAGTEIGNASTASDKGKCD